MITIARTATDSTQCSAETPRAGARSRWQPEPAPRQISDDAERITPSNSKRFRTDGTWCPENPGTHTGLQQSASAGSRLQAYGNGYLQRLQPDKRRQHLAIHSFPNFSKDRMIHLECSYFLYASCTHTTTKKTGYGRFPSANVSTAISRRILPENNLCAVSA